jgi:hypothetical protein
MAQVETKREIVHFDVSGEWFTWMLRHLWIESNELKAVKMWQAAFPELSSVKIMKTHFLAIVTGRKKFTGWASGDGFQIEPDNQKFWDSDQSGEGNKAFPLLQSWEDVILLKKTKLFIAELRLRQLRMNRSYPSTYEGCQFNSFTWLRATEENALENTFRRPVNLYLTELRNIFLQFDFDNADLEMLPVHEIPLQTGPTFKDKKDRKSLDLCKEAYDAIMKQLKPIKKYFAKKYGTGIHVFRENDVAELCRLNDDVFNRQNLVDNNEKAAEEDRYQTKKQEYIEKIAGQNSNSSVSDAEIAQTAADEFVAKLSTSLPINPFLGVNVQDFVKNMIEDSHRDRLQPEDPKTTKWNSGYINRDGQFYACSDIDHINFAKEICEGFNLKRGDIEDTSQILDALGWVKVSMKRFFWDADKARPTEAQKSAMFDFMIGKAMQKALFNSSLYSELKTMGEAFADEDNKTEVSGD